MKLLLMAILLFGAASSFAADRALRHGEIVALLRYDGRGAFIGQYSEMNNHTLYPSYNVAPLEFYAKTGEWVGEEGTKVEGVFRKPYYNYEIKDYNIGYVVREYHGFQRGSFVDFKKPDERRTFYKSEILDVFSNGVVVLKFHDGAYLRTHVTTLKKLGLETSYED